MCNVSQNYFCRLFKEYSGITPQDFLLKAKLSKAKIALKETSLSVFEIAEQCGFQDASYFCRIFKKKTGVSPLKYRKGLNL
jgi:AraC-like DNA-binding protein